MVMPNSPEKSNVSIIYAVVTCTLLGFLHSFVHREGDRGKPGAREQPCTREVVIVQAQHNIVIFSPQRNLNAEHF